MRKSEIEMYRDHGRTYPSINVKWHTYTPDLVRRWRDDGHEFSGEADFWQWVDRQGETDDEGSPIGATDDQAQAAWEMSAEGGWEDAHGAANDVWPYPHVKVYGAGRSGGHLIVDGLPDVDGWDAIAVSAWSRFARKITDILADRDYQFIWHLYVNVYEADKAEREATAKVLVRS